MVDLHRYYTISTPGNIKEAPVLPRSASLDPIVALAQQAFDSGRYERIAVFDAETGEVALALGKLPTYGEEVDPIASTDHNFWITPDGAVYVADHFSHGFIARMLALRGDAPGVLSVFDHPRQWLKVSTAGPPGRPIFPDLVDENAYDPPRVTQRQFDALFDLATPRPSDGMNQQAWRRRVLHMLNEVTVLSPDEWRNNPEGSVYVLGFDQRGKLIEEREAGSWSEASRVASRLFVETPVVRADLHGSTPDGPLLYSYTLREPFLNTAASVVEDGYWSHWRNPSDLHWLEGIAEEGYGGFEDYYPLSAGGEIEPSEPYYGRNVIWDGIGGRMLRAAPEYMVAISGNIFDPDKLAAVRDGIIKAEDRVVLTAPYGTASLITPEAVKESIEAAEHGDAALERPLSTGDEDLDLWLVSPERFMEEQGYDLDELREYEKAPASFLDDWSDDPEGQDEKIEELEEAQRLVVDMERRVREAEDEGQGDLGKLVFTIRDGNHRAFGALLAGEPFVWMILDDNSWYSLEPDLYEMDRVISEALK